MVIIDVQIEDKPDKLYMDGKLYNGIIYKVKPNIQIKDEDLVWVIDGPERSGKSVMAMQLAKVLDPNFNLNKICMTSEEFTKAVTKAKKGECIIYDEAFTGLSARGSLTEINRLLISLMVEMGQKNLYILIVTPTIFMLDKYVTLHRAKGLFHIYKKNNKRGYWAFFNRKRLKLLYLFGKKMFSYANPKSKFRGRFLDKYTINEADYRAKKKETLNKKSIITRHQVVLHQRNALIYTLYTKFNLNQSQISEIFKQFGFSIARNTLSEAIANFEKWMKEEVAEDSSFKFSTLK